jgi:hypothetical protein
LQSINPVHSPYSRPSVREQLHIFFKRRAKRQVPCCKSYCKTKFYLLIEALAQAWEFVPNSSRWWITNKSQDKFHCVSAQIVA